MSLVLKSKDVGKLASNLNPLRWSPPRLIVNEVRSPVYETTSEPCPLIVQTSPRPKGNSLRRTLETLERVGLGAWRGPKILVADGYDPKEEGWETHAHTGPARGSARTFLRAISTALTRQPDLGGLLYLQDDVVVLETPSNDRGLTTLDYLRRAQVPDDVAFVTHFSQSWPLEERDRSQVPKLGIVRVDERQHFNDNQCVFFPRRTLEALLALGDRDWPHLHKSDMLANRLPDLRFAVHSPNLVEHAEGENSAAEHSCYGPRLSALLAGESFDVSRGLP